MLCVTYVYIYIFTDILANIHMYMVACGSRCIQYILYILYELYTIWIVLNTTHYILYTIYYCQDPTCCVQAHILAGVHIGECTPGGASVLQRLFACVREKVDVRAQCACVLLRVLVCSLCWSSWTLSEAGGPPYSQVVSHVRFVPRESR